MDDRNQTNNTQMPPQPGIGQQPSSTPTTFTPSQGQQGVPQSIAQPVQGVPPQQLPVQQGNPIQPNQQPPIQQPVQVASTQPVAPPAVSEFSATQEAGSEDMRSRHVPDLTASQQVLSDYAGKVTTPPPAGTPPLPPEAPKKKVTSAKSGLPKPLVFVIAGFAVLCGLFIALKILAGMFGSTSNGKVTLTYWGLWEDKNVMQTVLSDFERSHPNITVNYVKQDPADYTKSLLTRIPNGNGPDIYRYHISWLPLLLSDLLPLSNQAITKSDFTKTYYPVMQEDLIKNGGIYGIPLEVDTLALFINKKMFDDAKLSVPTTWDSFITTAGTLTKKDTQGKIQVAGAALGTYANVTHAPDIISLLLVQNGVDLSTMTPASNASDALTFYTSFASSNTGSVWDTTLDPSLLAFERNKLAMYIGYSWDIFAIKAASPDLDFAIYPVPHLPGRDTTIASYWVEGVSSKTAHPKEAMELMNFLSQKSTATKLYTAEAKTRLFGEPYARVDLAPLLKSDPLVYPFVAQATSASSSLFAGDTQDGVFNATLNQYLGNAVNSMLKDTSGDSAVSDLTKGVSQVLNQYAQP